MCGSERNDYSFDCTSSYYTYNILLSCSQRHMYVDPHASAVTYAVAFAAMLEGDSTNRYYRMPEISERIVFGARLCVHVCVCVCVCVCTRARNSTVLKQKQNTALHIFVAN